LERFSRRSQSLFARGDGDLSLPKPVKGARLSAKLLASGEFRFATKLLEEIYDEGTRHFFMRIGPHRQP
jgi:hypothetical protein